MAEPTATERAIAEGARISEPQDGEDLIAQFKAIQAELGGPEEEDGAAELAALRGEEAPAKAAPAKGKDGRFVKASEKPDEPAKPANEKTGTEGKLSVAERVALREEKRQAKQQLDQARNQLAQREQALLSKEASLGHIAKARELFEQGDYDGAAKAAFGVDSWNALNDQAARAFASPEYRRVKALEEQTKKLEQERETERRANMTAQQQQREQQILTDYRSKLNEQLPQSENETVAALAEVDPQFVEAVFHRVVAAARQGEDIDPTEAAEEIVEQARAHYERVHKVFGGRPTSMAEAGKPATPVRAGSTQQPVKPHKHVSRTSAVEASAPPEFATDADWLAFGAKALKRAQAEDEAAGRTAQW